LALRNLIHVLPSLQVDFDIHIFHMGAPQVEYRESIRQKANIKYAHKKQSGVQIGRWI